MGKASLSLESKTDELALERLNCKAVTLKVTDNYCRTAVNNYSEDYFAKLINYLVESFLKCLDCVPSEIKQSLLDPSSLYLYRQPVQ